MREAAIVDTIYRSHDSQDEKGFHSSDSSNGSDCRHRIVVVGCGSSSYALLQKLKRYPVDLSIIINMASIGGGTGLSGQGFGLPLFDDFYQCLAALNDGSPEVEAISSALGLRFGKNSSFSGVSMGSLLMAEIVNLTNSVECALKEVRHILKASGEVIPACLPGPEQGHNNNFHIAPVAPGAKKANPRAIHAIAESDAIVLGPGSLHSGILPCLSADGMAEAIASSGAIRIYVCDIVTSKGEMDIATASGFLRQLINQLGSGNLDWAVLNNAPPEASILENHNDKAEQAVIPDVAEAGQLVPGVISAPLIDEGLPVRYNPEQTVKAIFQAMLVGRIRQGVCRVSTSAMSAKPLAYSTSFYEDLALSQNRGGLSVISSQLIEN